MNGFKISGKTENLTTLLQVLALAKGDDCLFPHRKIVIQLKPDGTHVLAARQLAPAGSIYSQVLVKEDGTEPFLTIEGEGDLILDMAKALKFVKELGTYQTAFIKHDAGETVFGSFVNEADHEEYTAREDNVDIDDAAGMLGTPCNCGDKVAECKICGGTGVKPGPVLSYKNKIAMIPPALSVYPDPDIQFDVDSNVMRTIGKKSAMFSDNTFPLQFGKDSLVVSISNPNDIKQDSFKKAIPVTYKVNKSPEYKLHMNEFYKNIFENLTGNLTIFTANLPPEERSIYVVMNKTGGLHTGIQVMGQKEEQ